MTVRKTFQWSLFLVALLAAGGWYALQYAVDHKDQLVLQGIRDEVARKVPDWGVGIGSAKFDMSGRVWLTDITIAPNPRQPPLVTIPKCLVTIDPDLLLNHQQLYVRSVRVIQPQIVVSRDANATWNWQGLSQPAPSDQTPEIFVDHGELLVRLQAAAGVPQTEVASRNINLRLVPDGHRRYLIEGASQIDGAGALAFGGELDLNNGVWRLLGEAQEIDMSQGILEKAAAFAPELGQRVAELSGKPGANATITPGVTEQPPPNPDRQPVQTASLEQSAATPQLSLPNLGLSANIGLAFDLSSNGTQQIPNYRVWAKVVSGTVTEPLSPVPLSNLQGELLIDNGDLFIHNFSASNGESQLSLSGEMQQIEGRTVRDFNVSASNLLIDDELRYLLPASGQKLFDLIRPAGLFTVRGRFRSDGTGPPNIRLDEFRALNCSMSHQSFPYPVTGLHGTIKQAENQLLLDLDGMASGQPVRITGSVRNPGPEAETRIGVQVNNLPLDQTFVQSIVAPKQQPARKTIESLGLTGQMDIHAVFSRTAGLNQPVVMGVDIQLTQGNMNYELFPYGLSQFSGHVKFDPWREQVWHFTNLRGKHGPARLTGSATYDLRQPGGGQLDLHVDAEGVPFDQELLQATTTAVPDMYEAWTELNLDEGVGNTDLKDVHLTWSPGTTPLVEMPSIQVNGAAVTLRSFPFRFENVTAGLTWRNNRLRILQLQARHRETQLVIEGRVSSSMAYFQLHPPGQGENWRLHFDDITVRNLNPDGEFQRALPGDVAAVLAQLNPRGPIDAALTFDLKGFPDERGGPDIVTSVWDLVVGLEQDRLSVGLDLTDVTGQVQATIVQNGGHVHADGRLQFDTAQALGMTLTDIHSPFEVDDYRVTIGSPIMLQQQRPGSPERQVPLNDQLTAKIYGGSIEGNADVRIHPIDTEQTIYQARLKLKNADIKQWATEWGYGNSDIVGTADGQLQLHGQGTSELGLRGDDCWMTITDARLGELPIVAQMLKQIVAPQQFVTSQQRDKTAFRYAYLDFSIHDGVFDFGHQGRRDPSDKRRIHLTGDVLSMGGQGYVPFAPQINPQMDLNFYSKADKRNPILALPILGSITKSVSDNWIHVRVSGMPENPVIRMTPGVPVDNALRQFLGALETSLMPMVPPPR